MGGPREADQLKRHLRDVLVPWLAGAAGLALGACRVLVRALHQAPEQVRERLLALARDDAADELVVVTITHDPKARLRSYELLAEVFELPRREESSP
jgi:alkanesulfonate monooxygenase SsuD/methylene tetrahydromethanopterin reductase-like flavin-dependent oxidoreductase (luciferase family)